jgi:UDP-N-acetylglucosamine transferase subunit ALG13
MDEIALRIPSEMVIQRGYSKYSPKNVKHFDFVPLDTATEYIRKARLVVSHAGMGTIILCKEYGIPILIFPRRKRYGEHMNDHQLEIAKALEKRGGENIYVIYEEDQLEEKILKVLKEGPKFNSIENIGRVHLIRTIQEFIKTT